MAKAEYRVYVIKLDPKVLEKPRFRKANPDHDPRKSCIYVGSTGIPPEERFEQHKQGINSNGFAREFGIRLLTSVMDRRDPASTKIAAIRKEAAMARRLRHAGYAVWPTDEAFQREIEKLEERRRAKLAERANRRRAHRRKRAAGSKAAPGSAGSP